MLDNDSRWRRNVATTCSRLFFLLRNTSTSGDRERRGSKHVLQPFLQFDVASKWSWNKNSFIYCKATWVEIFVATTVKTIDLTRNLSEIIFLSISLRSSGHCENRTRDSKAWLRGIYKENFFRLTCHPREIKFIIHWQPQPSLYGNELVNCEHSANSRNKIPVTNLYVCLFSMRFDRTHFTNLWLLPVLNW